MQNINNRTRTVVTCGIFVALSTVLSLIQIPLPFLLYGGSVTFFSMVPIVLISQMYGNKTGLLAATVYGLLQALLGATTSQAFAGVTGWSLPAMLFLDYIAAFAVLGLGGAFMKRIKSTPLAVGLGAFLVTLLRYVAHFLSGYILWGSYAEWFFSEQIGEYGQFFLDTYSGKGLAAMYSLVYNGLYMVPEIIITVIGCVTVAAIPTLKKMLLKADNT